LRALLIALLDLLLYSNFWIALAAVGMAAQSQLLLSGRGEPTALLGFIFFATLFLYAVHRIIGLRKSKPFTDSGRYAVIARFRNHIVFYAGMAGLCAGLFLLQMPLTLIAGLIAPCLLALLYVLPVWKGYRLRDLHYVKIFLIAITWSWITVFLVALELGMTWSTPMYVMLLERVFFVFAITIPFDIRDLEIDAFNKVKTLPAALGVRSSQRLAGLSLGLMLLLAALNYYWDVYALNDLVALVISACLSGLLIFLSDRTRHDYFFSGLVDGMMVLQFLLVALL
jgi:4-hydroxybenzoate polyprenyltransferase